MSLPIGIVGVVVGTAAAAAAAAADDDDALLLLLLLLYQYLMIVGADFESNPDSEHCYMSCKLQALLQILGSVY